MRVQNFSDQQLVSDFLSGDSLSIEHLIIRHKDKVFRFIISKVKDVDLANDIFQDVFIKVINKLVKVDIMKRVNLFLGSCEFLIIWSLIILEERLELK